MGKEVPIKKRKWQKWGSFASAGMMGGGFFLYENMNVQYFLPGIRLAVGRPKNH